MASPGLAIAKAALVAGFMRPDPTPLSRDELFRFHELLDSTLKKCSSHNIQLCKDWLVRSHVSSSARAGAVGKYLVALSSSLDTSERKPGATSARKQQLHILYLLNDLLHHYKYHERDRSAYGSFLNGLRSHIPQCLRHAAGYDANTFPRHKKRIQQLLKEWSAHMYFDEELQVFLEDIGSASAKVGHANTNGTSDGLKKETPFIMPAVHGDPSAPYHELPAGNMMPHIIPNTSRPIIPHQMRALQFTPGPADPALVEAVKSFLKDVDVLYATEIPEDEGISMEMDDLGQNIARDKQSGQILSVESYYGWSKEFCERMKRKQNSRRRSRSRSTSRSRSDSPRKRRRFGSANGTRNRSQSRSYSRSRSRSRSISPPRRSSTRRPRSRSWSRSRSRSQSRSRSPSRKFIGKPQTQPPPPSQQFLPQQPPPPLPPSQQQIHLPQQPPLSHHQFPPQPPHHPPHSHSHPPPLPPPPPQPGMPYQGNYYTGGPAPPPRPPNWQGPWPPPPPPPSMPPGQGYGPPNPQHYPPSGGWQNMGMAFPPPSQPPGPPSQHQDTYNYGFNHGYNQRGGYGDRGHGDGRGRGGRW